MFTNVTLLYFLFLIPLSGFIAWIGDRIGHKSGKRRHSLFGLRPRHTAMLFTIGTGVCISLLSFGLIWATSESFRIVMRDGVALVDKNRDLKNDNTLLTHGNDTLRQQSSALVARAEASRQQAARNAGEARKADHRRDQAVQAAIRAEARTHEAEAGVMQAQARLAAETGRLREAQTELTHERRTLTFLKSQLDIKAGELRTAQKRIDRAEKLVADAEARATDAKQKATSATQNLARVEQIASDALETQKKNLEELRRQLVDQKSLFDQQKSSIEQQSAALTRLNGLVAQSQTELNSIRTNIDTLRKNQITYQNGEEVDRIAVKPGYNVWRIETILGAFLTTAAKRAEARGAGRTKDGEERAIVILPKVLPADNSEKEPRVVTENDSINAAAAAIRRSNTEVVVLVNAMANTVAGEPVPVEFKIYKNPVVLTADTTVGEAAIDGNGSRQQIADALYTFLHQQVRRSLLNAGIIPPARGGDNETASTAKGAATGGNARTVSDGSTLISLSGDEWLQILDKIREAGPRARIVARAARDMRAGDPVSLRFEVKGPLGIQSAVVRTDGW